VAAAEGSGSYQLTTSAPLHATSALGNTISSGTSGSPVAITLPTMSLDSGATAATVNGSVTLGAASSFDSGFALITKGGQLIDVISLDAALAAAGVGGHADFSFNNIPGGIRQAVYNVSVRLWNSNSPVSSLVRLSADGRADLRFGSSAQVSVTAP
jgi:hypothetical protein